MKKDLLAALTFLITGLLFYVVGADSQVHQLHQQTLDCNAAETLAIGEIVPASQSDLTFPDTRTHDS